jgi:UPF0716 protein FxsA
MTFRSRLLLFGYPLLELLTAYFVAQWIGWGWTLLLLLAGFPIGFAIMRNASDAAMRDLSSAQNGTEVDAGRHALTFVGGLLFLVPGFWSDLLGLLLVLPPTQRLRRRNGSTWISSRVTTIRMPGASYPSGDVIQGTVITDQPPRRSDPPGPPPELNA